MHKHHFFLLTSGAAMLSVSLAAMTPAFAAKPVDLQSQSITTLQSMVAPTLTATSQVNLKQISANVDFNQTTHIRMKETYAGYPVWGSDAVVHVPHGGKTSLTSVMANGKTANAKMNGVVYQELNKDLQNTPAAVFTDAQAKKALDQAVNLYQKKSSNKSEVSDTKTQLMVYVDSKNQAHWAYLVSFVAKTNNPEPALPTYIMDANNFSVYREWNDMQTVFDTFGGGFGGNKKTGKQVYDGLNGDLAKLDIQRAPLFKTCYLQNHDVTIRDMGHLASVMSYKCPSINMSHNGVYWTNEYDAVNGAFSPGNDALFAGRIIQDMYKKWYNTPALVDDNGKPLMLTMNVHIANYENAFFDPRKKQMFFGDGGSMLYPLVSLGVGAHEISHGFTSQHSDLVYQGMSGGLNEAYSDMAAQAAEFYAYGNNSWQIGPEIFKEDGLALRYMDEPTKDCAEGQGPGQGCSISNAKDFNDGIDVHYTSGVFNKAFYLIATADGWNTKKAFDVMVQANEHYWTANTTFTQAACGVLKATQDYQYDVATVVTAMSLVGVDTSEC